MSYKPGSQATDAKIGRDHKPRKKKKKRKGHEQKIGKLAKQLLQSGRTVKQAEKAGTEIAGELLNCKLN